MLIYKFIIKVIIMQNSHRKSKIQITCRNSLPKTNLQHNQSNSLTYTNQNENNAFRSYQTTQIIKQKKINSLLITDSLFTNQRFCRMSVQLDQNRPRISLPEKQNQLQSFISIEQINKYGGQLVNASGINRQRAQQINIDYNCRTPDIYTSSKKFSEEKELVFEELTQQQIQETHIKISKIRNELLNLKKIIKCNKKISGMENILTELQNEMKVHTNKQCIQKFITKIKPGNKNENQIVSQRYKYKQNCIKNNSKRVIADKNHIINMNKNLKSPFQELTSQHNY